MDIKKVIVGLLETNCYIISIANDCIVIDPGDNFETIKKEIGSKNVVGCLVTHFHYDHIGALEALISTYNVEINKPNKKFDYEIIETPGHTFDSKTFYFKQINTMFIGDFIFKNGIGRTDLGGNVIDLKESLEMIKKYPDNTILYPGHGDYTTLGDEKKHFSEYF